MSIKRSTYESKTEPITSPRVIIVSGNGERGRPGRAFPSLPMGSAGIVFGAVPGEKSGVSIVGESPTPSTQSIPVSTTTVIDMERPMDLGSLFEQAISTTGQVLIARAGQGQQQVVNYPGIIQPGIGVGTTPVYNMLDAAKDTYDYFVDPSTGQTVARPKKKRHRRRRRLATLSDIRDLAALKNILGDGQNLKAWIATHPTR